MAAKENTKSDSSITSIDDEEFKVADKTPEKLRVTNDDDLSGDKLEVTIQASEGALGHHAVFLGLNGNSYLIPRGKPFVVPVEVVELLENATMALYENGEEREVPRYSFTAKTPKLTKG